MLENRPCWLRHVMCLPRRKVGGPGVSADFARNAQCTDTRWTKTTVQNVPKQSTPSPQDLISYATSHSCGIKYKMCLNYSPSSNYTSPLWGLYKKTTKSSLLAHIWKIATLKVSYSSYSCYMVGAASLCLIRVFILGYWLYGQRLSFAGSLIVHKINRH